MALIELNRFIADLDENGVTLFDRESTVRVYISKQDIGKLAAAIQRYYHPLNQPPFANPDAESAEPMTSPG
jgi:hypothetical protein